MPSLTEHDFHSTSTDDDITSRDNRQNNDIDGREPLEKQSTAASGLSVFEQRAQSVVSRIRSREPGQTARFTHPLSHTKTSPDVIVDFDGPDDPYRPLNWGFTKKAVTTVLYGLTTMGMKLDPAYNAMHMLMSMFSRCYLGEFHVRSPMLFDMTCAAHTDH